MTEVEQPFLAEPGDSETTLIAPRFDAAEAEAAQAVVPLAAVSRRRVWPLLLLSAVFGGALSLLGLYLYQRPAPRPQTSPPTAAAQPANIAPAPPAAPEQSAAQVDVPRDNEHAQETAQSANTAPPVAPPAEHAAAIRRAPAKQNIERPANAEQEQATRGGVEVRPRLVDETRGAHAADTPHREAQQPRDIQSPPTATRKHPRNVDRIRDIFEGAPPPAQKQ